MTKTRQRYRIFFDGIPKSFINNMHFIYGGMYVYRCDQEAKICMVGVNAQAIEYMMMLAYQTGTEDIKQIKSNSNNQ